MTDIEVVKSLLTSLKRADSALIALKKDFPSVNESLEKSTSWLEEGASKAEIVHAFLNSLSERPRCSVCKKELRFFSSKRGGSGYRSTCSKSCSYRSLEREERRRSNCIRKFGTTSALMTNKAKEMRNQVMLSKFGGKSPFCSKEIQEKVSNTFDSKYGMGKRPSSDPSVSNSISRSRKIGVFKTFSRFSSFVSPLFSEEQFLSGREEVLAWKCERCGESFFKDRSFYLRKERGWIPRCPKCFPVKTSVPEGELKSFISSLGFDVRLDKKIIPHAELDMFVPEMNVAVEFDGLYWHAEERGKDREYHLRKTLACKEKGIHLIHVFEDEWRERNRIVKARIRHRLGKCRFIRGARSLEIRSITSDEAAAFVEKYHLQGKVLGSVHEGAFLTIFRRKYLVGVMSFSKPRIALGAKDAGQGSWELTRFCTVNNWRFPGLGSRMLRFFEKTHVWNEIISFCDRRWSSGESYLKMGFELDHVTAPGYWYVKDGKRFHRFSFRKQVLDKRLQTFDPTKTERENMSLNGWSRVWDCGNLVFSRKNDSSS